MNQLLKNNLAIKNDSGRFTSAEIAGQPATWIKTFHKVETELVRLSAFLKPILHKHKLNIILTGAGSSAYIGDTVMEGWFKGTGESANAVPTTDLLTHFDGHIKTDKPLLLVSFARSGNSPESKAIIDIANKKCLQVFHLIITCNSKGKLAKSDKNENSCVFLLPQEAEDRSLAMTNSFTSMALAAALIPKLLSGKNNLKSQVDILSSYGQRMIDDYASVLFEIAQKEFTRIVFLGSGPLWGIARESHLKVQELSDGRIIGKFDSFLGFRHGPKAILNNQTLLVYLLSNDKRIFRYERDLADEIDRHDIDLTTLGIAESEDIPSTNDFDIRLSECSKLDEDFWAILCTLPAQIIGLYKSLLLGLNPDNPSTDGTISRVVKGVKIYEDGS
jgi:tagatose-6-phosphate ketose/aldose isomerase